LGFVNKLFHFFLEVVSHNSIRNITVKELLLSTFGVDILKKRLGKPKDFSAQGKIDCDEDDTPLQNPF
jgi:hypothetical protein